MPQSSSSLSVNPDNTIATMLDGRYRSDAYWLCMTAAAATSEKRGRSGAASIQVIAPTWPDHGKLNLYPCHSPRIVRIMEKSAFTNVGAPGLARARKTQCLPMSPLRTGRMSETSMFTNVIAPNCPGLGNSMLTNVIAPNWPDGRTQCLPQTSPLQIPPGPRKTQCLPKVTRWKSASPRKLNVYQCHRPNWARPAETKS